MALMSLRKVSGMLTTHRGGVNLCEDTAKQEVNHAHNEKLQAEK
jgi:hypothetical protein